MIIFELLKKDGKSISALSKELEKNGYKFHRLILTGYLRALADMKILKERDVPPAKIYLPAKVRRKDIYEIVGERALERGASSEETNEISLFCLSKLFGRAIFEEEFKRTGIRDEPIGRIATQEERQEAKKFLMSSGFKIANSNRAFMPQREFHEIHLEILESIISDDYGLSHLVKEIKQTKLSL
ncbi:MAG: hypothetical protein GKC03_06045 [Methanomassiliicoccales archaeon]|nr:hypothetical protein [Methanomassiliicoccales archaeon]NYT15261.1 hypothetical protein [Methanomassiliicoccales archaeon]